MQQNKLYKKHLFNRIDAFFYLIKMTIKKLKKNQKNAFYNIFYKNNNYNYFINI